VIAYALAPCRPPVVDLTQNLAGPYSTQVLADLIAAANDGLFQRLCDALDLPDLLDDPRFATNADRVAGPPGYVDVAPPVRRDGERAAATRAPLRLGEHTAEVLAEIEEG
jgi:crotonobetainyl-CoA:carnitine CoA-transferase CaiB-like acyl-CoA transferase